MLTVGICSACSWSVVISFTCHPHSTITMGPYNCWVHDVFHNILIDSCDEYLKTSDHSTNKARSLFVTRIASDITQAAVDNNVGLPNDLEKVSHIS